MLIAQHHYLINKSHNLKASFIESALKRIFPLTAKRIKRIINEAHKLAKNRETNIIRKHELHVGCLVDKDNSYYITPDELASYLIIHTQKYNSKISEEFFYTLAHEKLWHLPVWAKDTIIEATSKYTADNINARNEERLNIDLSKLRNLMIAIENIAKQKNNSLEPEDFFEAAKEAEVQINNSCNIM